MGGGGGRALHLLPAAACLFLVLQPQPSPAQDFGRQLEEVLRLIEEKNYTTALDDIKFIAQQIQEQRLLQLGHLFPEPPEGWKAEPPVRTSRDGELWSRRLQVQRRYTPAKGTGKIELLYDFYSPLIPRVSMSLNPVYLAGDPRAEPIELSGEPGRIWFNVDTGEGDLLLILSNRVILSVVGRGIPSRKILLDFVSAVDLSTLASFIPP